MPGSWRTAPLPPNWPTTRARILERDGHRCTASIHHHRCDGTASEVDHITPASEHGTEDDTNLTALNTWCHRAKTAQEAASGRARRPGTQRPPEPHPGLT